MRSDLDPLDPVGGLYVSLGRWRRWAEIAFSLATAAACVGFLVWLAWAIWSFGPELGQP